MNNSDRTIRYLLANGRATRGNAWQVLHDAETAGITASLLTPGQRRRVRHRAHLGDRSTHRARQRQARREREARELAWQGATSEVSHARVANGAILREVQAGLRKLGVNAR